MVADVADNDENKALKDEIKTLKDKVKALTNDNNTLQIYLSKRSNLYCWHCGFELREVCPRCDYGLVDTEYRDA